MQSDDDLDRFRDALGSYLLDRVASRVARGEQERAVAPDLDAGLGAIGYLDVGQPASEGGLGPRGDVALVEGVAATWPALAATVIPTLVARRTLGDGDAPAEVLDRLGRGRARAAIAVVPGTVDDAPVLVPHVVNGADAALGLLLAVGPGGPRVAVVPPEGWEADPPGELDGLRAARVGAVRLRAPAPVDGPAGPTLALLCLLRAALALGVARRAQDLAVRYAAERFQFGRPIGAFGEIYGRLAGHDATLHAARAALEVTADKLGRGSDAVADAVRVEMAGGEAAVAATRWAQHVHGGYGHMAEYEVGRSARDARAIAAGALPHELAARIVARDLGLPAPSTTAALP